MEERKKTVLHKKWYYPIIYNFDLMEKGFIISSIILFICFLFVNYVFRDRYLANILFAHGLASWFITAMLFFAKLCQGYAILDDGIFFKYRFLKNKLLYNDIKCIIISNSMNNYAIVKTPHVTVIGGEKDEILQYCMNSKKRHVLSSDDIRYTLGAKIGCYHPGNIWEVFKKGSSKIYNYGFVWNKREMYKIFKGFPGDYYVAASILENFRSEFDDIVKEYSISDNRIHIIDDSTEGKFTWRY